MIQKVPTPTEASPNPLTAEEQALLEKLQQLAATGQEEIDDPDLIALIDRTVKWSYSDPASLERALYFMAHDPFYQRESRAINAEWAALEANDREGPNGNPTR